MYSLFLDIIGELACLKILEPWRLIVHKHAIVRQDQVTTDRHMNECFSAYELHSMEQV